MTERPVFDAGQTLRLRCSYRDIDSVLVDPGEVKFFVKEPDGTILDYTFGIDDGFTNPAVGVYDLSFPTTIDSEDGIYYWGTLTAEPYETASISGKFRLKGWIFGDVE